MSQNKSWVMAVAAVVIAVGMFVAAGSAYAEVPTFSQTSITVGLGKSVSVSSTNGVDIYVESNSSSVDVSTAVSGAQITLTGQALGTATIDVCATGTAGDCAILTVTTQSVTSSSMGISFSQNNLTLSTNSNQSVTISGGNGSYTISSNSNASIASANLSGNSLTISGSGVGSDTISVCDTSNTNTCGTLSVTVSSSSTSSGLSFSQNNISVVAGNSQSVSVSGGNGNYHISTISNSNAASAGISGSGLTVYTTNPGSAGVEVCDTANTCGTLNVTITASTASQAVVFSVPNPTLAVGQSMNITLSGQATTFVVFYNANPNIAQASAAGTVLSLIGVSAGTDEITICATGGGCNQLTVAVGGTASTATATTTPTTTSSVTPATVPPVVTPTVTPAAPSVLVVANTALLTEIQTLQTAVTQILTQIESVQTQLGQLEAQVNAGSGSGIGTSASAGVVTNVPSGTAYNFTEFLAVGSQDAQVTELQQRLTALGFYSGEVTGYYGTATEQAVMKYQTAHGITATGYVGPGTRAALNAGS